MIYVYAPIRPEGIKKKPHEIAACQMRKCREDTKSYKLCRIHRIPYLRFLSSSLETTSL